MRIFIAWNCNDYSVKFIYYIRQLFSILLLYTQKFTLPYLKLGSEEKKFYSQERENECYKS